jgi:hypothetical protein
VKRAGAEDAAAPVPPPPPVDITIREAAPPRRTVAVSLNPVPLLTFGTLSADVVIMPREHHALVLSPFYTSQTTNPINVYDAAGNQTQLPQQTFRGFGAEIGYRRYLGQAGPRGFFYGPSLLVSELQATAANGSETSYTKLGLAIDAGYSVLVGDRLMLMLGGGLQYTLTTKSIPSQQFPVNVYANGGLWPRVLGSIGWAF